MIVSITCRHGTQVNTYRNEVSSELMALSKYVPTITRVQAVFSKETHHKHADDLITCHLCIHIPDKHQLNIYSHQPTEMQAFDHAKERIIEKIHRVTSIKYLPRPNSLISQN